MRIYRLDLEHNRHGRNWRSVDVHVRGGVAAALRAARRLLESGERVEQATLLAESENDA